MVEQALCGEAGVPQPFQQWLRRMAVKPNRIKPGSERDPMHGFVLILAQCKYARYYRAVIGIDKMKRIQQIRI
jgi:hypothetical protein